MPLPIFQLSSAKCQFNPSGFRNLGIKPCEPNAVCRNIMSVMTQILKMSDPNPPTPNLPRTSC